VEEVAPSCRVQEQQARETVVVQDHPGRLLHIHFAARFLECVCVCVCVCVCE